MSREKYSPELKAQILKDLEETRDVGLVSQRHGVPRHAIYRFKRDALIPPGVNKDKLLKQKEKELQDMELENKILRELLKKTYQVMPIELD